MSTFSRLERELLIREARLRAAKRASCSADQANADKLLAIRLRSELAPARGPLPLFDLPLNGEHKP